MSVLDAPDRWIIEWVEAGMSGKLVMLHNPTTGQRCMGHDWTDWDRALRKALGESERIGDLVSEIEAHLARSAAD